MVFSLLGYFVSMIMVLAAAVGVMIGLSNFSTSEKVGHYPRRALERNFTATREPRLFMSVPDTKDGSPTKNIEASSAVAPDEQAEAKTSKPHKHNAIARQRNNYQRPSFGMGYAEYTRNGPQRPFSNW
ncbi:MAG: hypothetical protein WAK55_15575 [Xanthobacteraceae bacterium]